MFDKQGDIPRYRGLDWSTGNSVAPAQHECRATLMSSDMHSRIDFP